MTRNDFLDFFGNDEQLNQLSADDRIELFLSIMKDGDDITKELLNEVISDYNADIEIVDLHDAKTYNRNDFMQFLRDKSKLDQLTQKERTEIFRYALLGSSDFTKDLFEDLFEKYGIVNMNIKD